MGYIYLICNASNDTFKIGVTRDSSLKRLKSLQTGSSDELQILYTYKCEYPFRLEKMLHTRFKGKNIRNEWFTLSAYEVSHFEDYCKELDETIHFMLENQFFAKDIR